MAPNQFTKGAGAASAWNLGRNIINDRFQVPALFHRLINDDGCHRTDMLYGQLGQYLSQLILTDTAVGLPWVALIRGRSRHCRGRRHPGCPCCPPFDQPDEILGRDEFLPTFATSRREVEPKAFRLRQNLCRLAYVLGPSHRMSQSPIQKTQHDRSLRVGNNRENARLPVGGDLPKQLDELFLWFKLRSHVASQPCFRISTKSPAHGLTSSGVPYGIDRAKANRYYTRHIKLERASMSTPRPERTNAGLGRSIRELGAFGGVSLRIRPRRTLLSGYGLVPCYRRSGGNID